MSSGLAILSKWNGFAIDESPDFKGARMPSGGGLACDALLSDWTNRGMPREEGLAPVIHLQSRFALPLRAAMLRHVAPS